jgi:RimJ/RimL family protein N-acetyltransferase
MLRRMAIVPTIPTLETTHLRLRPFTLDDAPYIFTLLNEPSFVHNIGDRGVRELDDARAYIHDGPLTMYAEHGLGLCLVEQRSDGEPVGMCGLLVRPTLDLPDLGYAFSPAYWGRGYATEACRALLTWAKRAHGLTQVLAIVKPSNAGSIRVLEKLGFVRDGQRELGPGDVVIVFAYDDAQRPWP